MRPLRLLAMRCVRDTHSVCEGIVLKDGSTGNEGSKTRKEACFQIVRDALELLRDCDSRRFRLVQREIRFIVLRYLPGGGAEYASPLRECRIHFHGFLPQPPSPEEPAWRWWLAWTASALVHEATHGRLIYSGIPYRIRRRANWQRVERICKRQQQHFAERIPDTTYRYARDLVKPLDVAWYEAHFRTTRRQRLRNYLAYLREKKCNM